MITAENSRRECGPRLAVLMLRHRSTVCPRFIVETCACVDAGDDVEAELLIPAYRLGLVDVEFGTGRWVLTEDGRTVLSEWSAATAPKGVDDGLA